MAKDAASDWLFFFSVFILSSFHTAHTCTKRHNSFSRHILCFTPPKLGSHCLNANIFLFDKRDEISMEMKDTDGHDRPASVSWTHSTWWIIVEPTTSKAIEWKTMHAALTHLPRPVNKYVFYQFLTHYYSNGCALFDRTVCERVDRSIVRRRALGPSSKRAKDAGQGRRCNLSIRACCEFAFSDTHDLPLSSKEIKVILIGIEFVSIGMDEMLVGINGACNRWLTLK